MSVLLLRLAGPLQAWGDSSRFIRRETRQEPTKSGILGLCAAAQGRRRTDSIEDLATTTFGVRVDQPGRLVRDFQTARSLDEKRTMPLSCRYYLADAVFVAAIEADQALLEGLLHALRQPTFPLYLGRRSCPPSGPLALGLREATLSAALQSEPWQAARWHQRTQGPSVDLPIIQDAGPDDPHTEAIRDHPLSFDPVKREYGWRTVTHTYCRITNLATAATPPAHRSPPGHDPMAALGGA